MFSLVTYVAMSTVGPYEGTQVGRYQTVLLGNTWQRVDLDTGDVCMSDIYVGRWICTDELNLMMEIQALERELAPEPEWFNDPSVRRDNA